MKSRNFVVCFAGMVLAWSIGCATMSETSRAVTPNGTTSAIAVQSKFNTTKHTEVNTKEAYDECMVTNQNMPFPDMYCRSVTSGGGVGGMSLGMAMPGMIMPVPFVTFDPTPFGMRVTQQATVPGVLAVPSAKTTPASDAPSKEDVEDAVAEARAAKKMACEALKAQGKKCKK
ncbi:MAG: hypothetical protein WC641_04925 [Patescibacteria group bacterium]